MKRRLILIMLTLLGYTLYAQIPHKVVLTNGTVLRGKLESTTDNELTKIKTLDGTIYSIGNDKVEEIGKTSRKERRSITFDRPFGIFIRPELGIGIGCCLTNLTMGIQMGSYYALYGGIELNQWLNKQNYSYHFFDYSYCSEYGMRTIMMGNRVFLCNNKTSPFIDIRIGWGQYVKEDFLDSDPFLAGGLGVTLGSLDIGVMYEGCMLQKKHEVRMKCVCVTMAYNLRKSL